MLTNNNEKKIILKSFFLHLCHVKVLNKKLYFDLIKKKSFFKSEEKTF